MVPAAVDVRRLVDMFPASAAQAQTASVCAACPASIPALCGASGQGDVRRHVLAAPSPRGAGSIGRPARSCGAASVSVLVSPCLVRAISCSRCRRESGSRVRAVRRAGTRAPWPGPPRVGRRSPALQRDAVHLPVGPSAHVVGFSWFPRPGGLTLPAAGFPASGARRQAPGRRLPTAAALPSQRSRTRAPERRTPRPRPPVPGPLGP